MTSFGVNCNGAEPLTPQACDKLSGMKTPALVPIEDYLGRRLRRGGKEVKDGLLSTEDPPLTVRLAEVFAGLES